MKYIIFSLYSLLFVQAMVIISIEWVNSVQSKEIVSQIHQIRCLEIGKVWIFDDFCVNKRP